MLVSTIQYCKSAIVISPPAWPCFALSAVLFFPSPPPLPQSTHMLFAFWSFQTNLVWFSGGVLLSYVGGMEHMQFLGLKYSLVFSCNSGQLRLVFKESVWSESLWSCLPVSGRTMLLCPRTYTASWSVFPTRWWIPWGNEPYFSQLSNH